MAAARIKQARTLEVATIQTEFHVPLATVLDLLIDDAEVAEGDSWSFVDAGGQGLVVVRKRSAMQRFDKPAEVVAEPAADPEAKT